MRHEATTKCCDHEFKANDIQGRLMSQQEAFGRVEHNLYGGNAERFARATCPECNTRYIMWLKRQSPNFRVLTITKVEDEIEAVEEENNDSEDEPEAPKRRGRKPQTV